MHTTVAFLHVLLAQAAEVKDAADQVDGGDGSMIKVLATLALVVAVLTVPFFVGKFLAKSFRAPEFATRIGVVLFALSSGGLVVGFGWPPKLGVDLKGGVILTYEVADRDADRSALIEALQRRINPSGTKEIVIRPYGSQQVEIIIPEVDTIEVERIQQLIEKAGVLAFRIVANNRDHAYIIEAARAQAESPDPAIRVRPEVHDGDDQPIGRWVRIGRETVEVNGVHPFKVKGVGSHVLRDGIGGKILDDPQMPRTTENQQLEKYLADQGVANVQVLVSIDDGYNVTGDFLASASSSFDENARPCVNFQMSPRGATLFGALTHANRPTDGFHRQLGIVLDSTLESAPNLNSPISQSGQITGSFTSEEVNFLVNILRAGKLPSTLRGPTSNNQVGSLLGADTIDKGTKAIGISLAVVLVFIAIYYRFAGVIACLALLLNLLLILAVLILFQQPLTLPGLAGLVLTVGMSVDANVLIFERIREELHKGAALRMAIRNGFSRATTTIVDANLTTLITAIVLYAIGTDQIKGFAVTLIVGILMSMFTAIFCSRVVFELAERKRWISQLSMMELLGGTNIDFIGKRRMAAVLSLVLIVIGLGAVVARGRQIFDIDFLGGTSVTMMLETAMDDDDVRKQLDDAFENVRENNSAVQYNLSRVSVDNQPVDRFWKVNTSLEDVDRLKDLLKSKFKLATHSMEYTGLSQEVNTAAVITLPTPEEPKPEEPKPEEPKPEEPKPEEPTPEEPKPEEPKPEEPKPEEPKPEEPKADEPKADEPKADEPKADEPKADEPKADEPKADEPKADEPKPDENAARFLDQALIPVSLVQDDDNPAIDDAPAADAEPTTVPAADTKLYVTTAELEFGSKINYATLLDRIESTAKAMNINAVVELAVNEDVADWTVDSPTPHHKWKAKLTVNEEKAQSILANMQSSMSSEPVWHAADKIGSQVAGKTQSLAIWALFSSLLGIVAYIWIRFQKVVFGLAAVVALVHDVLITLGAIAISFWLAGALGFLQIEEFKISLPVVAAFLTIIGYSLNDTIVVFDRIREVRGKNPNLTEEMINTSINQTLGRTLLTSITTMIVVLILYAGGGQSIHGFSFALLVGVMVGTYSSIFVASPALLWMMNRATTN